jgi:hypothetical protein
MDRIYFFTARELCSLKAQRSLRGVYFLISGERPEIKKSQAWPSFFIKWDVGSKTTYDHEGFASLSQERETVI